MQLYSINGKYPDKNFQFHLDENAISAASLEHTHKLLYLPLKNKLDDSTVKLYQLAEILKNNNGLSVNEYKGVILPYIGENDEYADLSALFLYSFENYTENTQLSAGMFFKYSSSAYKTTDNIQLRQNDYIVLTNADNTLPIYVNNIGVDTVLVVNIASDLHVKFEFLELMSKSWSNTHSIAYSVKNANVLLNLKSDVNHTHTAVTLLYSTTTAENEHPISLRLNAANGSLTTNENTINLNYESPYTAIIKYIENANNNSNDFLILFSSGDSINHTEGNTAILQLKENTYA